jgi:hypothetical protein
MKVMTSLHTKKPSLSSYDDIQITMLFERHGHKFAVHRSYNNLISCYMLSEYSTGRVLKAYAVPKMDMKESDIDRCIERAHEYLDTLTEKDIEAFVKPLPVVNSDDPEVYSEPSYKDIEVAKRNAKIKEEAVKRKFKETKSTVQRPTKTKSKAKPKPKKRGRPRKSGKVNKLI